MHGYKNIPKPPGHTHADGDALPAGEVEFEGHATHALAALAACATLYLFPAHATQPALPRVSLYEPAGHATQRPASQVYPGMQRQPATAVVPTTELEYSGHGVHMSSVP